MDQFEFEALLEVQQKYLNQFTAETQFTAGLLCQMHKDWLGAIYAWAGRYRTVDMSKGGFQWPPAFRVAPNMEYLEKDVLRKHTPCTPGDLTQVAHRMAVVHAELLLVHPFRDGNGRLARWMAGIMAQQAGQPAPLYRFELEQESTDRADYLHAVQRGYVQDYAALTAFFREAMERRGAG
jgi:cell filamentation protein